MKFKKLAVGGTFEFMHDGHIAILEAAFESGEEIVIGIVGETMVREKNPAGVQPFDVRRKALDSFLESRGWSERADVQILTDTVGPAASDKSLEAIVVSTETRLGADNINQIREANGLEALEVIEIPMVLAEDGKPISSARIRAGEIDAHGKVKKTE